MSDKNWLADKLKQGRDSLWHEPQTQRYSFTHGAPRLVQAPGTRNDAGALADDIAGARHELSANLVVDLLSIRIRARDMKHRGKLVETWLRGSLIRRVIERPKPNRIGVDHNRYSCLIGFLVHRGIAESDGNRNGYRWTDAYRHLPARADWLVGYIRREGELRLPSADRRYTFED
jgi:hypothetical protein